MQTMIPGFIHIGDSELVRYSMDDVIYPLNDPPGSAYWLRSVELDGVGFVSFYGSIGPEFDHGIDFGVEPICRL